MQQIKNDKPILFKTPMVQAIQEDRKDITRRCNGLDDINKSPDLYRIPDRFHSENERLNSAGKIYFAHISDESKGITVKAPYGPAGTILWVRETFRKYYHVDEHGYTDFDREIIEHVADNPAPINEVDGDGFAMYNKDGSEKFIPNKPSIHMPKSAARIWLKVISTRAERLHDITEEDCIREGIEFYVRNDERKRYRDYLSKGYENIKWGFPSFESAKESFKSLWVSINGQESWDANPWVFRVEFEVLSTTGKPDNV